MAKDRCKSSSSQFIANINEGYLKRVEAANIGVSKGAEQIAHYGLWSE